MMRRSRSAPWRERLRGGLFAGLCLFVVAWAADAAAQGRDGGAGADLEALIATLEDPAARDRLVARLQALLAAQRGAAGEADRAGPGYAEGLAAEIGRVGGRFAAGVDALLDAPGSIREIGGRLADPAVRAAWIEFAWALAAVFAAGLLAEAAIRRLLARPRARLEGGESDGLWVKLPSLLARTVLDLLPVAGFFVAAHVVLLAADPRETARIASLLLIAAGAIARAAPVAARGIFAPHAPGLRLPALSDIDANYLVLWVRRFANIGVYGYFLVEAARRFGLAADGVDALRVLLGLVVGSMLVVLILQNRDGVAARLAGATGDTVGDGAKDAAGARGGFVALRRRFADVWHVLAILYVLAGFGAWAFGSGGGFDLLARGTALTALIVAAAGLALHALTRLIERGLAIGVETRRRFPGLERRAGRYMDILRRVLRMAVLAAAALASLQAWGVESFAWLASGLGLRVVGSLITVAVLAAGAALLSELVGSAIERRLAPGDGDPDDPEAAGARARTLLPLLRTALTIALAVMIVMIGLAQLGVDIGPMIAGAGIVGLAVGFGAQTLVKDVITGFFILMEDQIAVGDVVRAGSHAGLVEGLSLRTIRLRDLGGNVHIVPFSEVTTVENMTKEFSRYVFDVGVAYREDVDHVVSVLERIGAEMAGDEHYGPLILEPLEILGVDRFDDSAVIVKARITTRPIKQWEVGREFNRRMKRRFDELGIEIPFPHRTLYFGADKTGAAPPARLAPEPPAGGDAPPPGAPPPR